jgi:small-conductance mechanosensitive channel
LVFFFSGGQSTNVSSVEEETNQVCVWAILAILLGVFALIASAPPAIKAPFSAKWKVQKITEEMKQSIEDQKKKEASESLIMSFFANIRQFLQKPFPETESWTKYFRNIAFISLFVALFLYVFEPFGISTIESGKALTYLVQDINRSMR